MDSLDNFSRLWVIEVVLSFLVPGPVVTGAGDGVLEDSQKDTGGRMDSELVGLCTKSILAGKSLSLGIN